MGAPYPKYKQKINNYTCQIKNLVYYSGLTHYGKSNRIRQRLNQEIVKRLII